MANDHPIEDLTKDARQILMGIDNELQRQNPDKRVIRQHLRNLAKTITDIAYECDDEEFHERCAKLAETVVP